MRKHLYLVTEHENPDLVGTIKSTDTRLTRGEKNKETPFHKIDEGNGEFYVAGKHVHLGYVDFEDDDPDQDTWLPAFRDKLTEIDERHLEKAGVTNVIEEEEEEVPAE